MTKLDAPEKKAAGNFYGHDVIDGPHYGENLKLDGNGQYNVTYKVTLYTANVVFGVISEKQETGVTA